MSRRTILLPFAVDLRRSLAAAPTRQARSDHAPHDGVRGGRHAHAGRAATLRAERPATASRSRHGATARSGRWSTAPGHARVPRRPRRLRPGRPGVVGQLHREADGLRLPSHGPGPRCAHPRRPQPAGDRVRGQALVPAARRALGRAAPGPHRAAARAAAPVLVAELGYYDLHVVGVEKQRADALRRVCAHATRLEARRR